MPPEEAIAQAVLAGFNRHYSLFRAISATARQRFEAGDWAAVRAANVDRIQMYDERVREAVEQLQRDPAGEALRPEVWPRVKASYVQLLHDHAQPECAETFYNSVACHLLHRSYYHNTFIFWRPAVSTEYLEVSEPAYRSYYPRTAGLRTVLRRLLLDFGLALPWEDMGRDLRRMVHALRAQLPRPWRGEANLQIQVLASLFFRNKGAYAVGRAFNGAQLISFVIPLLRTPEGRVYVDALLLDRRSIDVVFSYTRAYFMVDMAVPSAYVAFLSTLMPHKPRAELYSLLGLQKHGKTLFYRDLDHHLRYSSDHFVTAPGTKGMVMLVFTLPSYPYVFKLLRDHFAPPKEVDHATVKSKYLLVKFHDRVGRLADTLEYSHVALPLARFDPALVEELLREAGSCVEQDGAELVFKHIYIERRMTPLNLYLEKAGGERLRHAVREYGNAIRELAGANIFPGDMLIKNFGMTRHERVVFYDYDEICYLTECRFKHLPRPRSFEDEMAAEPWFDAGPEDVFPEQFIRFLFPEGPARDAFIELHGDLLQPDFWRAQQQRILGGEQEDVFPYDTARRFPRAVAGAPA